MRALCIALVLVFSASHAQAETKVDWSQYLEPASARTKKAAPAPTAKPAKATKTTRTASAKTAKAKPRVVKARPRRR